MKEIVDQLKAEIEAWTVNADAQLNKGNKAAGARARKSALTISKLMKDGKVASAYVLDAHGIVSGLAKASFGNNLGIKVEASNAKDLFANRMGDIVVEMNDASEIPAYATVIGSVTDGDFEVCGVSVSKKDIIDSYKAPLEKVFPSRVTEDYTKLASIQKNRMKIFYLKYSLN